MKKILYLLFLFVCYYINGQIPGFSSGVIDSQTDNIIISYPSILDNSDSCLAWYENDVTYISTTGTDIDTWADKTINGNDLIAGSGAPTYQGDSIYFDGTDDELVTSEITAIDVPCTVYAIIKQLSWEDYAVMFSGYTANSIAFQQQGSSPDVRIYNGAASGYSSDLTLGFVHLVVIKFNGVNSSFYIDDNSPITGDFGNTDPNGIRFGRVAAGGYWAEFSIEEYILMDGINSSSNETSIVSYLNTKYGL